MKKELTSWISKNKIEFLILTAILLVAAFMRLYRIADYMTFLGDEGRDVLVVKRILVDHRWTLLGPTASVGGFFLGPVYYYFMLPFLWLFRLDPVGPAVMVALFGIATVFLVYKVGKEFFNREAGLIASLLYALSPLVIAYSRSSWNPNLVPFFSLLYIYSLYKAVKTADWRWWFVSGFCIGIGLQLHYLFTFLIPTGIIFLLICKKGLSYLKFWGLKFAGLIIGYSPFLLFELRHSFPNFRTLYQFVLHGKETGWADMKIQERLWEIVFRLFSRLVFYFPPPEQLERYKSSSLFLWKAIITFSIIVSLAMLIVQALKKKKTHHWLLIIWLLFGASLFLFYKRAVYDYYLGFMFPLPFLLLGFTLSSFLKSLIGRLATGILLVALVAVNLQGIPFRDPPNRQLDQTKQITSIIFREADGQPFNFALITRQNSDHAYRYFLEVWGNSPVVIENPQIDPDRNSVTEQLLVVCEVSDCKPLGHSLWEIAGFGRAEIVGDWPAPGGITVMKLTRFKGE